MPHIRAFSTAPRKARQRRDDLRLGELPLEARAAGRGEHPCARGIVEHGPDRIRERARVFARHEQAVRSGLDQFARPVGVGRDHRPAGRPRLDHHVAERLVPRGADEQVRRRQQRALVGPPAGQVQPVRNPLAPGQILDPSPLLALARDHRMDAREQRQRAHQHVERLVPVQPSERQDAARPAGTPRDCRPAEGAPARSSAKLGR